jgi:hypothetical protein
MHNLPLRERIADSLADAMFQTFDVLQMIECDPQRHEFHTLESEVRNVYETINDIMRRIAD